jgi:Cytochrome c oxidase assembly protein PET191
MNGGGHWYAMALCHISSSVSGPLSISRRFFFSSLFATSYSTSNTTKIHPSKPKACSEAALSLLNCMEQSKCVVEDKKTVYECLKRQNNNNNSTSSTSSSSDDDEVCKPQRNAYYMCKHSQLNMRTRIRGTRAY